MARTAGDYNSNPVQAYKNDWVMFHGLVDIGASGAPTVQAASDPGISFTRTGAGTYTLVYPAFPNGSCALLEVWAVKSTTIVECSCSVIDTTAGTATLKTSSATATAADPANGDILAFRVGGRISSAK